MTADRLVIGIGNTDRGDDAAGILVARALERTRSRELVDCVALLELWDGESDVVVVDAMRSGKVPGTVSRFDATASELPVRTSSSTHSFGLAETIELGRALGRLPPRLTVLGIEADDVGIGDRLSEAVEQAVSEVAAAFDGGEE